MITNNLTNWSNLLLQILRFCKTKFKNYKNILPGDFKGLNLMVKRIREKCKI